MGWGPGDRMAVLPTPTKRGRGGRGAGRLKAKKRGKGVFCRASVQRKKVCGFPHALKERGKELFTRLKEGKVSESD